MDESNNLSKTLSAALARTRVKSTSLTIEVSAASWHSGKAPSVPNEPKPAPRRFNPALLICLRRNRDARLRRATRNPQRNSGSPTHFRVTSPEVVARESHCSATTHSSKSRTSGARTPSWPLAFQLRTQACGGRTVATIRLNRRARIASALTMCLAPLSLVSALQTGQFRTLDRSGLRSNPLRGEKQP
jgi:hypothetical protein